MNIQFTKATKEQLKLKMAICGPSGSGKTYSALKLATCLGTKIACVDTERSSARKYADEFSFNNFDLLTFHPLQYTGCIQSAVNAGFEVLIIDSLSHAWIGKDGMLELADQASKKQRTQNTYTAWRDVTPFHMQLIDMMLQSPIHIIVTMRSKMEYVLETVNGKQVPRRVGMAPVQREGMEYEFDIVGDMDLDNNLVVTKTRCRAVNGKVFNKPGKEFMEPVIAWLNAGEKAAPKVPESYPAGFQDPIDKRFTIPEGSPHLEKVIIHVGDLKGKFIGDITIEDLEKIAAWVPQRKTADDKMTLMDNCLIDAAKRLLEKKKALNH